MLCRNEEETFLSKYETEIGNGLAGYGEAGNRQAKLGSPVVPGSARSALSMRAYDHALCSNTTAGPGNCWSRTRASCTQSLSFVASTRYAVLDAVSRHEPGSDKPNAWLQAGFEDDEGQFQQGVFNDFVEPFIQDARKHRCVM